MLAGLLVKLHELRSVSRSRWTDDGDHCCTVCGHGYGPNMECACEVTA